MNSPEAVLALFILYNILIYIIIDYLCYLIGIV